MQARVSLRGASAYLKSPLGGFATASVVQELTMSRTVDTTSIDHPLDPAMQQEPSPPNLRALWATNRAWSSATSRCLPSIRAIRFPQAESQKDAATGTAPEMCHSPRGEGAQYYGLGQKSPFPINRCCGLGVLGQPWGLSWEGPWKDEFGHPPTHVEFTHVYPYQNKVEQQIGRTWSPHLIKHYLPWPLPPAQSWVREQL